MRSAAPDPFQRRFAANLWGRQTSFAPPGSRLAAQPGFAVYRNTVMKGCIDALAANYPAVARLVGGEWFRAAAAVFVAASPPRSGSLVAYGAGFAEFLQDFEPAAVLPYLPDVARLDRCWTTAHVAADADVLAPDEVARWPGERLAASVLRLHPATRHAWFDGQPIYSIWSRNREGAAGDGDGGAEGEPIWRGEGALLTRPDGAVRWSAFDRAGVAFLDACAAGAPVAVAAEAALAAQADADLAALFAQLLGAGAFAAATSVSF